MALRLIELLLPQENSHQVDEILSKLSIVTSWQQTTQEGLTLTRMLTEADRTEAIIEALEERFGQYKEFRIILMEVKATSPGLEEEGDEAVEKKPEIEEEKPSPERVACLELTEKLNDAVEISRNYVLAIVLSSIVAAVGLLHDNVAVIIGAMVIAPLLSPNMALSLATTLGEGKLARRALKATVTGTCLALGLSVALGFATHVDPTVSEIANRADVGYTDIVLGLAAGGAGALAFTSGISAALVGVMVAVAILPPIVAAGLLFGSGFLFMGTKALLLALVNIICVNLAGVGIFLWQGIRPHFFWEETRARRMIRIAVVIWAGLLVLLVVLIYLNRRFVTS